MRKPRADKIIGIGLGRTGTLQKRQELLTSRPPHPVARAELHPQGTGDLPQDLVTDVADFNVWNSHRFTGSDQTVVPEPIGWAMGCLPGCLLAIRRRSASQY